jgi:hypothetical protein
MLLVSLLLLLMLMMLLLLMRLLLLVLLLSIQLLLIYVCRHVSFFVTSNATVKKGSPERPNPSDKSKTKNQPWGTPVCHVGNLKVELLVDGI